MDSLNVTPGTITDLLFTWDAVVALVLGVVLPFLTAKLTWNKNLLVLATGLVGGVVTYFVSMAFAGLGLVETALGFGAALAYGFSLTETAAGVTYRTLVKK